MWEGSGSQGGKAWAGRFRERTHALVEMFTSSLAYDRGLYAHDILGSIAHCKTLERAKVLTSKESRAIIRGLGLVKTELDADRFPFAPSDEDIHMAIERRLTELIGPVGGKLHTGRSRNDQVALDIRLFLRDAVCLLIERVRLLQRALLTQAKTHLGIAIPGYTHLQRAQPVLLSHHWLAYVEMLDRDAGRLQDAFQRLNVMPLGSGALAGSNYPVDRLYTAKLLGFPAVSENSLDAVSDRDFAVEILSACALIMMHLSRFSEELVLWSSQEFQFIELPDGFCTGSSMMPQKKNPDIPELVRGKTGRVYGHLIGMLTVLKGLPLSYNRDLQEDKEGIFDTLDTVANSLEVLAHLIPGIQVRRKQMAQAVERGFLLATELADYLVTKGVPFREAHSIVGQVVRTCVDRGQDLSGLTLADLRAVSPRFEADALKMLTVQGAIDRKAQIGGTAQRRVAARIKVLERVLR